MSRQLLRIFTFGILGMSIHSMSALGQEGEEVLIPIPRYENITLKDSVPSADFISESKKETRTNLFGNILVNTSSQEKPLEKKDNKQKVIDKDETQSNLSFNFLYYIFYKFKPSEVFEKK